MRPRSMTTVAALLVLLAAAADAPAARALEAAPVHLTIAFTGDVNGYLEPCG